MKLVLLGTAGYHPNDRRHTACLMLPEVGVVLDAGTAFYRVRDYLCTREVDIYLTHAHLDHVVGLTYLFDVVRDRDLVRVTVHGTPEKLTAIQTHLLNESLFPAQLPCDFRALDACEPLPQGGRLTHFSLKHPGGAVGYRLDWPERSLAYVTDTTATGSSAYRDAVQGVDLLVHECNFSDEHAEMAARLGHSSTSAVARLARDAGVGRLVLVHVDPLADAQDPIKVQQAASIFPNVSLGQDRLELDF